MISVAASLFFFYVVLNMFTVQLRVTKRNPWRSYSEKATTSGAVFAFALLDVPSV